MAAEAASLSTSTDATSAIFTNDNPSYKGWPSTTTSGSAPADTEEIPRTCTLGSAPASDEIF